MLYFHVIINATNALNMTHPPPFPTKCVKVVSPQPPHLHVDNPFFCTFAQVGDLFTFN